MNDSIWTFFFEKSLPIANLFWTNLHDMELAHRTGLLSRHNGPSRYQECCHFGIVPDLLSGSGRAKYSCNHVTGKLLCSRRSHAGFELKL